MTDRYIVTKIKQTTDKIDELKNLKGLLYKRYENLIHKHWSKLVKQIGGGVDHYLKDDFYSESYLYFEKALKAVNLLKIKDENWLFFKYFDYYLSNLRNRTVGDQFRRNRVEQSIHSDDRFTEQEDDCTSLEYMLSVSSHSDSAETEFLKEHEKVVARKSIDRCLIKWGEKEKKIFELRKLGKNFQEIHDITKLNYRTIKKYLGKMKRDFLNMQSK
jgi:hypothetical protein